MILVLQGTHSAPLEANSSRKAGKPHSPLVVRERQGQDPRVHKRKPIPLFESPGSEHSPPRHDIFSPRRPLASFERGSLNTPPSVRKPLKQAHLTEASKPRVCEEAVYASSTEAQCNPVGPSESNTGAVVLGPRRSLELMGLTGFKLE